MTTASVVIPTRNRRAFLAETIATVLDQTCAVWELIVVDDASTDDTPAFLRSLRDPRIRTRRRASQGGRSAACNDGLGDARGEFVMFLDDDDLLRRETLDRMIDGLRAEPIAHMVLAACRVFHEDGDSVKVYRPATPLTRVIWPELLFGWWSNSGQNMYRTDTVRQIGGFDPSLRSVMDRKLNLAVALRTPVRVLPFVAMEYRQHEQQISRWAGTAEEREAMWRTFIEGLPPSCQPFARRIRRAAACVQAAEQARASGRFAEALALQLHAGALAPPLVVSPLTGRPFWWGLKKCLLRVRTA